MSTNEKHLPQLPTPELMQQAAENLLRQRVLNKGGRQPSEQTVKIAAKVMAARAMRELGSERDREGLNKSTDHAPESLIDAKE
jgi:hypothetical protein